MATNVEQQEEENAQKIDTAPNEQESLLDPESETQEEEGKAEASPGETIEIVDTSPAIAEQAAEESEKVQTETDAGRSDIVVRNN